MFTRNAVLNGIIMKLPVAFFVGCRRFRCIPLFLELPHAVFCNADDGSVPSSMCRTSFPLVHCRSNFPCCSWSVRFQIALSVPVRNVFNEGKLVRETAVANFATVQQEGEKQVRRNIEFYNLATIISAGYRWFWSLSLCWLLC